MDFSSMSLFLPTLALWLSLEAAPRLLAFGVLSGDASVLTLKGYRSSMDRSAASSASLRVPPVLSRCHAVSHTRWEGASCEMGNIGGWGRTVRPVPRSHSH